MNIHDTISYKLQLIPFALGIPTTNNVETLVQNINVLYKYITKQEYNTGCEKTSTYNEDVDDIDVHQFDIGPIPTCGNTKSKDIELDCQEIKYNPDNQAEPWNTDKFIREYSNLLATLSDLEAGGKFKLHYDDETDKYLIDSAYVGICDKYKKILEDQDSRKAFYKMWTTKDWDVSNVTSIPFTDKHTEINKEREEAFSKCIDAANKNEDLLKVYMEHVYKPVSSPAKKTKHVQKSYFEEWDKERTIRLSKSTPSTDQQLLLNI